jgi:hypothetical protein
MNDIYFIEEYGKLYKQSKFPGSSKILIHTATSYMWGVKVYQNGIRTYNVIKLVISTLVSSLHIFCLTYLLFNTLYTATLLHSMVLMTNLITLYVRMPFWYTFTPHIYEVAV